MLKPFVKVPIDSCDARMNKIRKKLCHCMNRMLIAKAQGNKQKYWFYAELSAHHKRELENVHRLKEMGFNDIFEPDYIKKQKDVKCGGN